MTQLYDQILLQLEFTLIKSVYQMRNAKHNPS